MSKLPRPQVPLCAAGASMATYWPPSIVEHGLGLNVTVMSYAGAVGFGFTTARCAVPDTRKLSAALTPALDGWTNWWQRHLAALPAPRNARRNRNTDWPQPAPNNKLVPRHNARRRQPKAPASTSANAATTAVAAQTTGLASASTGQIASRGSNINLLTTANAR